MHTLKSVNLKLLQKEIAQKLKENTEIALDIQTFALANMGNFQAIGDYTIQKLNIDVSKYEKKNILQR
jgi:hypothetical protein